MDHKCKQQYQKKEFDGSGLSQISYIMQEDFSEFGTEAEKNWMIEGDAVCQDVSFAGLASAKIYAQDSGIYRKFHPVTERAVISLWVKMDNKTKGVNVVTLYEGESPEEAGKVIRIDTEGAYFYSYDGKEKRKLCHYNSDDWYSIYISVNLWTGTYSLYIDGERMLHQAAVQKKAEKIQSISMGSYGGTLYVKRLHIYENPVPSVSDAVQGTLLFDAKELGVAADGKTKVTEQLQQLIDSCGPDGGVVYLKDGTYLSGCLEMKENVTLYIEENATLKGSLDIEDYPVKLSETHPNWNTIVQGPQKSLLYADAQDNICVMGGGTIDGSGDFPGEYGSESLRVCAILFVGCENARICDLYVKDAGMWTIPVVECDNLYIRDVNIDSTWYPNRDGIDICDCYQVLIENCNIKADDDAVCFKSGNESGCDCVLVRNTFIISTMANGIKFGTYSYGGFTNCFCQDCIIKDTRTCAIGVQCVDGGQIRNLQFQRILIQNVESVFFILIADKGRTPDWGEHRIGSVEEIFFDSIEAENVKRNYGNYLGGYEEKGTVYRIRDIHFHRVKIIGKGGAEKVPAMPPEFENQYPESNCFGILPGAGYFIRHAENVVFQDCETIIALPDVRESYYAADVTGFVVNGEGRKLL